MALAPYRWFFTGLLLLLTAAGCGGARHRKAVGPPPEYEAPGELDGSPASSPSRALPRATSDAGSQ